jgi:DNA-binding MarR family transcriptional regulator
MDKKLIADHDNILYQETLQYAENTRRLPRVRSFFWLLRCADALNKYASIEVSSKGDSRTGLAVLQILLKYPDGISQQNIAKQTLRTKQLIVMTIDKLEQKGYVLRSSNNADRRINYIRITRKGIDHLNKVFPHTVEMCDEAFSSLSDVEIEQLLPLAIKVTKGLWKRTEGRINQK